MILAHIEQNPPIHYVNKLEYFIILFHDILIYWDAPVFK